MTAGGDFMPAGDVRDEAPVYPKLFGIDLTPTVSGILIALLGAAAATALWVYVVQPVFDRNTQLQQSVSDKEAQLQNQADTQRQIAEARTRLRDAQQLQADVLGLFASPASLDTLLLDVNERVQAVNAGIQDPERRATLTKFDLNATESGVVSDSSLGTAVNGKLERRVYDVELRASFPQTQSIVRNIERLQPLLVLENFKSDLDSTTQAVILDEQGRLVTTGQPETRLISTFKLTALSPAPVQPATAPPVDPAATPTP